MCLIFQISFVIDERIRGKGHKRKVISSPLPGFKASLPVLPFHFFVFIYYFRVGSVLFHHLL
jgi:hypothetical protein